MSATVALLGKVLTFPALFSSFASGTTWLIVASFFFAKAFSLTVRASHSPLSSQMYPSALECGPGDTSELGIRALSPARVACTHLRSDVCWAQGLGVRVANISVWAFGRTTLQLATALVYAGMVLCPTMPSTSARHSGIFLPVVSSINERSESFPGPTAERMGKFLMMIMIQVRTPPCLAWYGQWEPVVGTREPESRAGLQCRIAAERSWIGC